MASGPCLRRCRVVRRYIPIRLPLYGLAVKLYHSNHVPMYFEPLWERNAVNTGVPCPKVPMHRKLGFDLVIANYVLMDTPDLHGTLHAFHRVLKPHGVAVLVFSH